MYFESNIESYKIKLSDCETGWEYFENSCYRAEHNSRLQWSAARQACSAEAADVVSINSQGENAFVIGVCQALVDLFSFVIFKNAFVYFCISP